MPPSDERISSTSLVGYKKLLPRNSEPEELFLLIEVHTLSMVLHTTAGQVLFTCCLSLIMIRAIGGKTLQLASCELGSHQIVCSNAGNFSSFSLDNYTDPGNSRRHLYLTASAEQRTLIFQHLPSGAFRGLYVSNNFCVCKRVLCLCISLCLCCQSFHKAHFSP